MSFRSIFLTLTFFSFPFLSFADELTTKLKPFSGTYELVENLTGECPKRLSVVLEHFGNETASVSIGFYCAHTEDCIKTIKDDQGYETIEIDNILAQLTDLNQGKIKELNENPMFPGYTGYTIKEETFVKNEIKSFLGTYKLTGKLQTLDQFIAKLDGKHLSIKLHGENYIGGQNKIKDLECKYKK